MKKMRSRMRLFAAGLVAAGMSVAPSTSQADVFFDPTGTGAFGPSPLFQFDWRPGNTLAIDGSTAVQNFLTGAGSTQFRVSYQAILGLFQTVDLNVALMPAGTELTIVGGFTEQVVDADSTAGNPFATFSFVDTNFDYLEIYYHGAADANNLAGTGFNNGQLILKADVIAATDTVFTLTSTVPVPLDQAPNLAGDNYVGQFPPADGSNPTATQQTVTGNGETRATGVVTDFDPLFFQFDPLAPAFFDVTFLNNIGLQAPFSTVDPSSAFVPGENVGGLGTAGPAPNPALGAGAGGSIGEVNGAFFGVGGGPDFQIQTDTSQTFDIAQAIPEPATLALLGMGGLGLLARRRRNA